MEKKRYMIELKRELKNIDKMVDDLEEGNELLH